MICRAKQSTKLNIYVIVKLFINQLILANNVPNKGHSTCADASYDVLSLDIPEQSR